jgi:hypothetical protein
MPQIPPDGSGTTRTKAAPARILRSSYCSWDLYDDGNTLLGCSLADVALSQMILNISLVLKEPVDDPVHALGFEESASVKKSSGALAISNRAWHGVIPLRFIPGAFEVSVAQPELGDPYEIVNTVVFGICLA